MVSSTQLGSWTVLCDISGQVSNSLATPVVTLAAVAVACEVRNQVRGRLVRAFGGTPVKWKVGTLDGLKHVSTLLASFKLPAAVLAIHRDERWMRFYAEGEAFLTRNRVAGGGHIPGFADHVLRAQLMSAPFAYLVGKIVLKRYLRRNVPRRGNLRLQLVVDSDIRSPDGKRAFSEAMHLSASTSGFAEVFGVSLTVETRVETEQDEPLLLLPDYLAGVFQHADPASRLDRPVVSQGAASLAVEALRSQVGTLLEENQAKFAGVFPLTHDTGGRVVRQRPTRRPAPRDSDMPDWLEPL